VAQATPKPESKIWGNAIIDKREKALTKNTSHMHGLCGEKALTEKRTPKIWLGQFLALRLLSLVKFRR